jgi:hypothetical protein
MESIYLKIKELGLVLPKVKAGNGKDALALDSYLFNN